MLLMEIMKKSDYTDEWGVTYSEGGKVLSYIDSDKFSCEEYTIPEGVERIEYAFMMAEAKNLRKIHLPSTLRYMCDNTFIDCPIEEMELPEGMTEVAGCMCENCRELKKVTLPSTIKVISNAAFFNCKKLSEINLPEGLEVIWDDAFQNCQSLRRIVLPSGLKWIKPEAFESTVIESLELPEGLEEIGYWAFYACNQLKSLEIPRSVKRIGFGIVSAHKGFEGIVCNANGYHVENDALIDDTENTLLCCWTEQKQYVVPECVDKIACISDNPYVETITVKQPVELTTVDAFAFDMALKKIDFQNGVKGITKDTFYLCNFPGKIKVQTP